MTDYYPLINKAISATDKSPPARLAVYEKVRAAMLKVQTPIVSETQLQTELRDLDEAIRRSEAEFAPEEVAPEPEALNVPVVAQEPVKEQRIRGRVDSYKAETKKGWIKLTGGEHEGVKDFLFFFDDFTDKMTPTRGEPVEFSVIKPQRGPLRAVNISRRKKRYRGKVKNWVGGYGFIECDGFAEDVFVHYKSIQEEGPRELCVGEDIEFGVVKNEKGNAARDITLFQSRHALERFANIDKLRSGALLEQLTSPGMAQHEDWTYKQKEARYPHPVLFNYILYTFAQLLDEKKVVSATGPDGRSVACGNTGLVTDLQEEIFALFIESRDPQTKQKWILEEFVKASNRKLNYIREQPDIANYFDDPTKLIYDPKIELRADFDHIMADNLERFPENLRSNPFQLRQNFDGSLENAIKRVRRNYKTAVPQFYQKRLQLLLPLCMSQPNEADLALVVSREGAVYIGSTVLPLDAAYNNARLIARPDREWL